MYVFLVWITILWKFDYLSRRGWFLRKNNLKDKKNPISPIKRKKTQWTCSCCITPHFAQWFSTARRTRSLSGTKKIRKDLKGTDPSFWGKSRRSSEIETAWCHALELLLDAWLRGRCHMGGLVVLSRLFTVEQNRLQWKQRKDWTKDRTSTYTCTYLRTRKDTYT